MVRSARGSASDTGHLPLKVSRRYGHYPTRTPAVHGTRPACKQPACAWQTVSDLLHLQHGSHHSPAGGEGRPEPRRSFPLGTPCCKGLVSSTLELLLWLWQLDVHVLLLLASILPDAAATAASFRKQACPSWLSHPCLQAAEARFAAQVRPRRCLRSCRVFCAKMPEYQRGFGCRPAQMQRLTSLCPAIPRRSTSW